ncbi:tropinone reductase homolog At2g29300-like [Papaver somniferum]|uniref:tropinone reductase homolog At2g29300-like n=1 Tax=Papaver somniferum TaxID=3469 RepID=UPI000E7051D3|nr:tropinone reductase homolog At2g29300-like [Papaver somniferum]
MAESTLTQKSDHLSRRWSLKGMIALVTGATNGIGYAIVEELAGLVATIHVCSRSEDNVKRCLKDWEKKGYVVTGSVCDASVPAERQNLMKNVSSVFGGKLNILVNVG